MAKSDEKPLSPEQLREILLSLRAQIKGDSEAMQRDADSGGDERLSIHLADQASDTHDQEFVLERLGASTDTLWQIDEAIERIDKGQFNVCDSCSQEISLRRLRIKPWADLCIACQREEEKG